MLQPLTVCIILMATTATLSAVLPFEGVEAAKYLLRGTKQLWSKSENHKRYAKLGDFKTALQDFYEVDPRGVQIVSKGTKVLKLTGQVGNRQLILTKCSYRESCMPVLEIRRPNAKYDSAYTYNLLGDPYDKIIYRPTLD